jgi:nucleoid DNA-binding protein
VFSPPKKRLSFNEQLQQNDGVLANHIATYEKVSYENALAKIAKQVAEIQQSLKQNETVSIKYVGDLADARLAL